MRERLKIIPFINNWDEANMPAGRTLQVCVMERKRVVGSA